jgi:hypothetical protein
MKKKRFNKLITNTMKNYKKKKKKLDEILLIIIDFFTLHLM